MRTKLALMFAVLVGVGSARADVGITPTASIVANAAASTQNFSFTTTGFSGSKISGIGLYNLGIGSLSGVVITLTGGIVSQAGTFSVAGSSAGTENVITWDNVFSLASSTTYSITIDSTSDFRSIGTASSSYSVSGGISDYWANPVNNATTDVGIKLYYDPASVPEPATMILTGSALAAGAVGAFFKRRRKVSTEVAA